MIMKRVVLYSIFVSLLLVFISGCNKNNEADNDLGGAESPMGNVGNEFWTNADGVNNMKMEVKTLDNGISTIDISGTITDPDYKNILSWIHVDKFGNYDDQTGEFNVSVKMKFTSEGIADYLNVEGGDFVLGKFDAKVGDKYTYESSRGKSYTRTVTARSETDEFPYGFYNIKTITIDEPGRTPAIECIEYYINHRFGLVGVCVNLQDGTCFFANFFSMEENP